MALLELSDNALAGIILCCPDPSAFASACSRLRAVAADPILQRAWLIQWHAKLAPGRPSQYAVITWKRARDWDLEELASWILYCLPDPPEPIPSLENFSFGPHPTCQPSPKRIDAANRHLSKGRPLHALVQLCPQPWSLLIPYAVKSGNYELVQSLLLDVEQSVRNSACGSTFGQLEPHLLAEWTDIYQVAATTALDNGNSNILLLVLTCTPELLKHKSKQLLRHAVCHSNAACLRVSWHHHNCSLSMAPERTYWQLLKNQSIIQVL